MKNKKYPIENTTSLFFLFVTFIEFIDTPVDIRDKYQYFTEANMSKLISQGYKKPFTTLEDGVSDYVKNYLSADNYY